MSVRLASPTTFWPSAIVSIERSVLRGFSNSVFWLIHETAWADEKSNSSRRTSAPSLARRRR